MESGGLAIVLEVLFLFKITIDLCEKNQSHLFKARADRPTPCCVCGCPVITVLFSRYILWDIYWTFDRGNNRNKCIEENMCNLCHFTLFHP